MKAELQGVDKTVGMTHEMACIWITFQLKTTYVDGCYSFWYNSGSSH